MWLRHFFGFAATFLSYFFNAIGTTVLGWVLDLAFLGGIAIPTFRTLHSKEGWEAVKSHWEKETKVAITYALWCSLIIYGPVAIWKLGQAAYDDHESLVARSREQRSALNTLKSEGEARYVSCSTDLSAIKGTLKDKQSLADSLQAGITSLQGPQAQQAANIASCINNLAKMNPKIREDVVVVQIPLYSTSKEGKIVTKAFLLRQTVTLLLVTTNEVEPRFHGTLKCQNAFQPSAPQLPGTSQTVFRATATPNRLSDREYEISATYSGTEWSPSHPAYLMVTTLDTDSPGECTFTPLE